MKRKIFWSIFATALAAVLLVGAFMLLALYGFFEARMLEELHTQANYLGGALSLAPPADEVPLLSGLTEKNRLTLIDSDGTVLYDNRTQAAGMANHADRPEVAAALSAGSGQSRRFSATVAEETLYYALRLADGRVLRLSSTQRSALGMLDSLFTPLVLLLLGVAALSLLLSRLLSKQITAPIGRLNLAEPLSNDVYDELSPLLLKLQHQNDALCYQLKKLEAQQRELAAITENMQEGLVTLNAKGGILSLNKSAADLFGVDAAACLGNDVLSLGRSLELQRAAQTALAGQNAQTQLTLHARACQLLASPVMEKDSVLGAMLMLLDVTEAQNAERARREFSANVSHELKTPLTSIVGYAEIIKDGMVKPEDIRPFAGRIYSEGSRLIALVEDIMRLSQMDEQTGQPEKEPVDLFACCEEVVSRLAGRAAQNEVTLSLQGESAVVSGIPKLLDEMIYNLVDNAIKYNRPGGSVTLHVAQLPSGCALRVQDTGIGIPSQEQARVFERFYRVDKSHSKTTGGTGLGLSIVKHGAAIHGAEVLLTSELGKGTCVQLLFPGA